MRCCGGHMSKVVTCQRWSHVKGDHMSKVVTCQGWSHVNSIVCHMSRVVTCHNGRVTECMDLRCRVTDYDWFLS